MNLEFLFSRYGLNIIAALVGFLGLMIIYWRTATKEMNVKDQEEKEESGE